MTKFVYEFLYRGRPASDPNPASWQLELRDSADPGQPGAVLNMTQAIEQGWDKKTIMADINARAVSDRVIAHGHRDRYIQQTNAADKRADDMAALVAAAEERVNAAKAETTAALEREATALQSVRDTAEALAAAEQELEALKQSTISAEPAAAPPSLLNRLSLGLLDKGNQNDS